MAIRGISSALGRLTSGLVDLSPEVKTAFHEMKAIVALESTIISHGMPYPHNYKTAMTVENIIRDQGAVPATIAILGGRIKVGLNSKELQELADPKNDTVKISRRDLAYVLANKLSGGTTVSGTLFISNLVGINIFVTGGIGGVHRNGQTTFDISADLIELGRTPSMVISSGVKSILDIGKTLEYLETQGVSVITYGPTKEFPAFYSDQSGHSSVYNVNSPRDAARLLQCLREINLNSGILLAVPIPSEHAIPSDELETTIQLAVIEAEKHGVTGKDLTPYLLEKVSAKTEGKSLQSNIALIKNNALVGGQVAVEFMKQDAQSGMSNSSSLDNGIKLGAPLTHNKPIVIGGAILDCTVRLEDNLKLDGRTVNGKIGQSAGGVGRNLADALAKMSSPRPLFISAVGNDQFGRYLLDSVRHTDRSGVEVRDNFGTACCNVLFDNTGECRIVIGDMKIHSTISQQQVLAHEREIAASSLVVIDSNLPQETMAYLLNVCSDHQVPVWFEPTDLSVSWKPFKSEMWEKLAFISPNINELKAIAKALGIPLGAELNLKNIDELLHQLVYLATPLVEHITCVMVTMGSLGLLMVSKLKADDVLLSRWSANVSGSVTQARFYPAPKPPSRLVNVSGAGDCLAAGFMGGMLRGLTEPECVDLGQQAAALSLQSSSPVPDELTVCQPAKTSYVQLL